jgi:hypothetical protein
MKVAPSRLGETNGVLEQQLDELCRTVSGPDSLNTSMIQA